MVPDNVTLIGAMIIALGYMTNRWMRNIDNSIIELGKTVNDWAIKAIRIETENVSRDRILAEHTKAINELWDKACPMEECPMDNRPSRRKTDREKDTWTQAG